MDTAHATTDYAEALRTLQGRPEALPWPQRRQIAASLADAFRSAAPAEAAVELAGLLAEDPKPEVRHAVAASLYLLRDADMAPIVAKLIEDDNAFVRKAAERSLDRRRRSQIEAGRKRKNVEQVSTDYSALERLHGRAAAERARQMCERFADILVGTAVHNMRGVITPLKIGAAALVKQLDEGRLDPKGARETAGRIADRVAFLERLLEDMRTYSQPVAAERRRERLADIVAEARASVGDYLRAAGRDPAPIALAVSVPESLTLEVSRHQVVVALANVLKNAYEAFAGESPAFRPGEISLMAQTENSEVTIAVRDSGIGLDVEDLRDLREFVPGRTSKKNCGTGFGLPIARRYIMAHGGSLAIDSRPGAGTTVTIRLPIEKEEDE